MKKTFNKVCYISRAFLFSSLLIFNQMAGIAQTVTVSGRVTESSGTPLASVSVSVKGTTAATTTAANGQFSIQAPNASSILVFTFIGYQQIEVAVGTGAFQNIEMKPTDAALQDVVVIGYGTVKKSDVTGSVASVKPKDFTQGANISLDQALAGRVAGVQVSQKSGEPGAGMNVKIRGISSITGGSDPLYVIDGMPVNNLAPVGATGDAFPANPNPRNPLNTLNPSDIESIEILKDASATAIYGSRGSNGVVIITTKRGNKDRLKISYNGYYGVQEVARKLDLLTGDKYKEVLNAIIDEGGGVPSERVTHDVVNTDWQQLLFRQAAIQNHDLSITGGSNNTRFYASLGYFNQEGVVLNSGSKRYVAKVNLENSVAKKYAFGLNLNTSYIQEDYNSVGLGINENGSGLYSAQYYDPSYPPYDDNGNYYRSPFMGTMDHPIALIEGQYANADNYRTFGNIFGEYFFIPTLSLKVRVGGDVNNTRRNTWTSPETIAGLPFGGIASINTGTTSYYMGEATLVYKNDAKKDHALTGLLGVTYDHYASSSYGGSGRGYLLPDLTYDAIGSGDVTQNRIGSGRASTKLVSYLARGTYAFRNKYLFTASVRADGSSRFGPNNRFAMFPSAAFAWKMHEESFLKDASFIDELKFRTSYGSVGNQNITNYLYFSTFSSGPGVIFNNSLYTSISPTRPANPDLQWEGSLQFDAGFDFSLFRGRLTGSVDYFNRKAVNLLLALPLPPSTGFGSRTENTGDMRNTGLELTLGGRVISAKDFSWTLNGNFTWLKNEVLNLGPIPEIIRGVAGNLSNYEIVKPGESIGSYYGFKVLGVWQQGDDFSTAPNGVKAGDQKYLDVDGNRLINASDRVILGKAIPDYTYGFTNTFQYKNLSLAMFFDGQQGASNISNNLVDAYFPVGFRRNRIAEPYLNRWTSKNPSNTYPSFANAQFSASGSQGNQQINSLTVQDASYFRMQAATLTYSFSMKNVKAISGLQLYVTGQNLFLLTNYIGYDPALNATGSDVTKVDYSSYPMSRNWLFGVNVQF